MYIFWMTQRVTVSKTLIDDMEWQGLGNEVQFQGYTEYVGWFVKKLTGFQRKVWQQHSLPFSMFISQVLS